MRKASFLLIVMITVSLEPKWRHFAQVNIADIFMLSSKLPKQNEIIVYYSRMRSEGFPFIVRGLGIGCPFWRSKL